MNDYQQSIFANGSDDDEGDDDAPMIGGMELYRQLAKTGQEKLRHGRSPSREETKAIREIAILEAGDTCWPDRTAAADALGITPKQLEKYHAQGMPAPGHSPIEKEPVYQWYLGLLRTKDGGRAASEADPRQQALREDVRYRRLKNDQLEGRLTAEAEAAATTAMVEILRDLKAGLLFAGPVRILDALAEAGEHEAEVTIRHVIADILNDGAEAAGISPDLDGDDDDTEPTTEATTEAES